MRQKGKKQSTCSNPANDESSPKILENERNIKNNSEDEISQEGVKGENDFSLNGKKSKKSKKEKTESRKEKLEESIEERDYSESQEKKKKSKKDKRKLKEQAEANDEVTQNVKETENDIVKKKKKKLTEEKSEAETEAKHESAENGEESDLDVKKKKKPSKRQLKREKQELKEKEKREANISESATKALAYVSKWKHAKSEWKFEKLKQIWLVNNLLDENLVPEKFYPTVLEYFEGCKGMVSDQLVKKAMAVITKVEELSEESEDAVESTEYQRARQLLQALPTDLKINKSMNGS